VSGGPRVSLIAAVAANGVIGDRGALPWRLSSDQKRFRRLTMGKPVVMGRKTFESIGKPLEGRDNIVVSRRPGFAADGVTVASGLAAALAVAATSARASGGDEIMVIGGGEVYAAALRLADRLYITHVDAKPGGDARFPTIDPAVWRVVSREQLPAGERDTAATAFAVYERVGDGAG
jgi:dihydrofolate reductase